MSKRLTYSQLQDQLEATVAKLETPDVDIEEAAAAYEAGLKLLSELEQRLTQAENTIERVRVDFSAEEPNT